MSWAKVYSLSQIYIHNPPIWASTSVYDIQHRVSIVSTFSPINIKMGPNRPIKNSFKKFIGSFKVTISFAYLEVKKKIVAFFLVPKFGQILTWKTMISKDFSWEKNDPDLPNFEEIKFQIARFLMRSSIR